MKTIVLNDLKGFDFAAVYRLVMSDPCSQYEVQLKKRYFAKKEYYSTFRNYRNAAFIGQKLSEIADPFIYWVPTDLIKDPFIFQIGINDPEEFADLVYYIVSSYINNPTPELPTTFDAEALAFHDSACENYVDRACWGLIEIADEYKWKYVRNEKRKDRKARRVAWRLKHPNYRYRKNW